MEYVTKLLVESILGLQTKYNENGLKEFCSLEDNQFSDYYQKHKDMVINSASLLYKIDLGEKDRKILAKVLIKNKELLLSINMEKSEFNSDSILMVEKILDYRYKSHKY